MGSTLRRAHGERGREVSAGGSEKEMLPALAVAYGVAPPPHLRDHRQRRWQTRTCRLPQPQVAPPLLNWGALPGFFWVFVERLLAF